MKKVILGLAVLVCILGLTACQAKEDQVEEKQTEEGQNAPNESISKDGTYEIAFMSGKGELDDGTFHLGTWEGVAEYADENRITYSYYRPAEDTKKAREEAIKAAVKKGAKVIIAQGYPFEEVIYHLQNEYPKVQFLLLDGEPNDGDKTYETASNVHCILFREEEAGYLAGYAAVSEGYTRLGVLAGKDIPQICRYGYGFIQGAEKAANEMDSDIELKYWYSDSFLPSDEIEKKMKGWYEEGTQVVFSCGGGISISAISAAEKTDGKVIGVDRDQSPDSDVILTSAVKNLTGAVVHALEELYDNGGVWTNEQSGKTITLGAKEESVELPENGDAWRFENFSRRDYRKIFRLLKREELNISSGVSSMPKTKRVQIDLQN